MYEATDKSGFSIVQKSGPCYQNHYIAVTILHKLSQQAVSSISQHCHEHTLLQMVILSILAMSFLGKGILYRYMGFMYVFILCINWSQLESHNIINVIENTIIVCVMTRSNIQLLWPLTLT